MNNFQQQYLSKSILNGTGSVSSFLKEGKHKDFMSAIFALGQGLAAGNEEIMKQKAEEAQLKIKTGRQAAAIRGYAERARATAARQSAAAAQERADAANRTADAKIAAIGAQAETARQLASVKAIEVRAKNKRDNELAGARGDALAAQANVNNARAVEIYSRVNSDENASLQNASAAASGNAVPALPAPTETVSSAKNASETLQVALDKNRSSATEVEYQLKRDAKLGLFLAPPKKGTPSIKLAPEPKPTTAPTKPVIADKPEPKSSVKANSKAKDKPAPSPAPVKQQKPKTNKKSSRNTNKSSGNKGRTKNSSAPVREGLTPEQLAIAAQIRRENDLKKRRENPPDERY